MRALAIFAALFVLWTGPSSAQVISQATCDASYEALSSADKARVAYGPFVFTCEQIRRPWESSAPAPPDPHMSHVTGLCADNTYTTSLIRANACRQEGGVVAWFFGTFTPPQELVPTEHLPSQPNPMQAPPRRAPKPVPQPSKQPETPTTSAVS